MSQHIFALPQQLQTMQNEENIKNISKFILEGEDTNEIDENQNDFSFLWISKFMVDLQTQLVKSLLEVPKFTLFGRAQLKAVKKKLFFKFFLLFEKKRISISLSMLLILLVFQLIQIWLK